MFKRKARVPANQRAHPRQPARSRMTSTITEPRTGWKHYIFYPLALAGTLFFIHADVGGMLGPLGKAHPFYLLVLIPAMVAFERIAPMRRAWGMTRKSFLSRDLPMLAVNGATIAATTHAVTWLARHHAGLPVHPSALPWQAQAICALLLSDFLWYWVHRHSHEGKGWLGRWLWKTHAIHHLPGEVYVFMHAVGHPINTAYVRVILMLPAILFGLSPEAVFAASVLNGFQGLVSHFNVDARAGWFNRLFIGTELHRFHHSANPDEAKNYAATVSIWDQLFGTYRLPARAPMALGVWDREKYPADGQWAKLLCFPMSKSPPDEGNANMARVPMNSVIATYLPGAYFHDALTISVNDPGPPALAYFLKALQATPTWVERLMSLRNYVMARLGLKDLGTRLRLDQSKPASAYLAGDRVGMFTLMMNSPGEVLLGDKDRHLDVTLSIYKSCDRDDEPATLTVTTVVHVHNWFGRLYMLPVAPIHRIIVPAVLKTIAIPKVKKSVKA